MSKSKSEAKYESLKAYYRAQAAAKEKELHMDLLAVRHEYVPHHLKRKFLTGLGIFGTVYLVEKLIFGKKLPRIIRFTTSLSATVFAPRIYRLLEAKLLALGEMEPIEMEMLEDQMLSEQPQAAPLPSEETATDTVPPEAAVTPPPPVQPNISDQESSLPPKTDDVPDPPTGTGEISDDKTDKDRP